MKKQFFAAAIAAALVLPMAAQAQQSYVGASIGRSEIKADVDADYSFKDTDTGAKLFGGYNFDKNFGVEVGFAHLGKAEASESGVLVNGKPKAFYAAATGTFPLNDQFSLSGKVGVSYNRTKLGYVISGVGADSDTFTHTAAMFGVGAAYNFNKNVSGIVEYENFGKVLDENGISAKANLISVGVVYKF